MGTEPSRAKLDQDWLCASQINTSGGRVKHNTFYRRTDWPLDNIHDG